MTVDSKLSPAGKKMINLLEPEAIIPVVMAGQRHAVRISLRPHEMAVLKLLADS